MSVSKMVMGEAAVVAPLGASRPRGTGASTAAVDQPTLVQVLAARAAQHPDRIAMRFLGDDGLPVETLSYAELDASCAARARLLRRHAGAGDRALLLYPSGSEYVKAFLACAYAGIVAVPAYPPLSAEPKHVARLLSIARDARPRLVLTDSTLFGALRAAQAALPGFGEAQLIATDTAPSDASSDAPTCDVHAVLAGDLAVLQYTSGSTAQPRGVEVTHQNLMANERAIADAFGMREDDVVVSWLPLFHDMGLIGTLLQPLYAGASAVLMSPAQFLRRPQRWLEAISRFRGTVSGAPDFAYRLCVRRAGGEAGEPLDLSSWRLAFCGAEPIRAATLDAFVDRYASAGFAAESLYPCYGLAEATLLVTGGERSAGRNVRWFSTGELERGLARELDAGRSTAEPHGRALVSCGRVRPGHELRVVELEHGGPLPEGRVGEIQVRGPSVARGYFGNAAASRHTFSRCGEATWLRTGDLGFLQHAELFVTGRAKEVIIVRGRNLYPQDIENSVEDCVSVARRGRTVAFSFETNGEEQIAVVAEIPRAARQLIKPAAVCQAIAECVGREHGDVPGVVLLLEQGQVPVTSSGKLQRAACRAAWRAGDLNVLMSWSPA